MGLIISGAARGLSLSPGFVAASSIILAAIVFLSVYLLSCARKQSEKQLSLLYQSNTDLYMEVLEKNRLLPLVFRRSVIALYKLEGCMKLGRDGDCRRLIEDIGKMKLQPRDWLHFLQLKLSFFTLSLNAGESRGTLEELRSFLKKSGASEVKKYKRMLREAEQIVSVYIDRDTSLLPKLIKQAESAEGDNKRGVLYFRAAKLSYFAKNQEDTAKYLKEAAKYLKNSEYSPIIESALADPAILEYK